MKAEKDPVVCNRQPVTINRHPGLKSVLKGESKKKRTEGHVEPFVAILTQWIIA